MAKLIAHRSKGNPYLVLIYRDLIGRRRQKSLGRLSEGDAQSLRQKGGEVVTEVEERRLLRGFSTLSDIKKTREEVKQKEAMSRYNAELIATNQNVLARFLRYAQGRDQLGK